MSLDGRARWLAVGTGLLVASAVLLFFLSFESPWALRGENKISLFPMNADAWRQWRSGHFPLWTSGMFGGFPLFAGSQSSALYLPHALAFLSTPAPHWRAMDVALALHAGLLTSGCVRLLLHLGVARVPAILGAVLVLFAPQVVYWTSFVPMFASLAWWPWLFLAADRLADPTRRPLGAIVLGATALAAQVYVGYVEYAVYSGCFAAAWIFASPKPLALPIRLAHVALLALSAALLAAPQLLPTALELRASARSPREFLPLGQAVGGVLSLVDPREGGRGALPSAFLGAATLVLAVSAVALRASRSLFLCGLAVASALLAFGPATPLYGWLTSLPLFELFRTPFKFFVVTNISIALLAALGLDAILSRGSRTAFAVASLLATAALVEYGMHLSQQLPVVARAHVRGETGIPAGIEGFEAFLPDLVPADPAEGPPPRTLHIGWLATFGSLGEVYGVESILGHPPALLGERPAHLLRRSFLDGYRWIDRDWVELLGVELVTIRGRCARFRGRGLEKVRAEHGYCLLRNAGAPARFELLTHAQRVDDLDSELQRVLERPGGPVAVVVAATPPATSSRRSEPAWLEAGPLSPDEGVETLAYRPGSFRLLAKSQRERLLLVREARNEGWHAQVDGNPAPILPAGGLFFAIPIPAGEHVIEIAYSARGLGTGLALAGGWLIGVAGLWLRTRREHG